MNVPPIIANLRQRAQALCGQSMSEIEAGDIEENRRSIRLGRDRNGLPKLAFAGNVGIAAQRVRP
jgi:hypothetical protein